MQARFLPSCSLFLPFPSRKADEGLATISEDGRSPISLKQMAYGEHEPGLGLGAAGPSAIGEQRQRPRGHRAHSPFPVPFSAFFCTIWGAGSVWGHRECWSELVGTLKMIPS